MNPKAKEAQLQGVFPALDLECVEAFNAYFQTLLTFITESEATMGSQETIINTLASTHNVLERLSTNENFAAGQEAAGLFRHFASLLNLTVENSFELEAFAPVDKGALLLGMNEQLQVVDNENLAACARDGFQFVTLVKAVVVAAQEHKVEQALENIGHIMHIAPELRNTCVASLEGFEAFFGPIVKAFEKSPQAFLQTIKKNVVGNQLEIAADLTSIVQQLESGDDYEVGVALGKVIQVLLRDI
jgi:hypothetical protein